MKLLFVFAVLTVTVWACGDSDRPDAAEPGTAGGTVVPRAGASGGGMGGHAGSEPGPGGEGGTENPPTPAGGEGGSAGSDAEMDPLAPTVRITQPEAVASPAEGEVLTDPELEVTCLAEPSPLPGAQSVDPTSVAIELFDAQGELVDRIAAAATSQPNIYSAELILAGLPTGRVELRCTAADNSRFPRESSHSVETFFDRGPVILIEEPAKDSVWPLLGVIPFEFGVAEAPLSADDPGSAIESVLLRVRGVDVPVTRTGSGSYVADVNLKEIFPVPPTDSVPVEIRATNARGVEQREDYAFFVDGKGPSIQIVSPELGSVLGGAEELVFEVTDERSRIDPESIVVVLNREEYRFDGSAAWSNEDPTFRFAFDAAQIRGSVAQLTVTIRARDEANNEARGGSALYYIDNEPPLVSLDHPNIREIRRNANELRCSLPFDPLGSAAVNDLDVTGRAVWFRALVYDRVQEVPGQSPYVYALTNPDTVTLYLHQDFTKPFLVDLQGDDGKCDDVAEESRSFFKTLTALPQAGRPPGGDLVPTDLPVVTNECAVGLDPQNTEPLCQGNSDLVRVIDHEVQGPASVIYAIEPSPNQSDVACDGRTWEVSDVIDEGWVCAAVVAEDNAGNRDVSAPLRFCFDDGEGPDPDCDLDSAPTCEHQCDAEEPPLDFIEFFD